MKSNYSKLLLGLLFFLSCLCLSSCKIMTSSDYKKAKEVVTEVFKENDLHGKVTITKLSWTALEYPQYHVSYTYSEKTYDDQTVQLEDEDVTFKDDWSDPGKIYVGEIPDDLNEPIKLTVIKEGLTKNHGYCRTTWDNKMAGLVTCQEGVFVVTPPQDEGTEWTIKQIMNKPVSDIAVVDIDEDGEDELGLGTTRVIDGVVMMVTGTDANGVQIGEFGSSEGILEENIMWGRPGCPEKGEIFIKTEVIIKEGTNMERPGPLAAHAATDFITQEIREALKKLDDELIVDSETFEQVRRPGKKKVVIVKEIMGQGAMHDNLILPMEPVGVLGAKPNVDLGNVPVMVSPLEVLDGCIHALTCIGPASKEMSRHYWREPLVLEALHDEEVDLCGVIFVGSPQINAEKFYVSRRVGMMVEALDVDGAFVTTEGFGNNHIDFASHIEQIGMRGIPVVGMSFCAVQGALVVGNKYMTNMVDNNKSEAGIENEILGCNTLCHEDAIRALYSLKAEMGGEKIAKPEKKWNPNVKDTNLELISNVTGKPVELVENETSLPMSQKRKEKYS